MKPHASIIIFLIAVCCFSCKKDRGNVAEINQNGGFVEINYGLPLNWDGNALAYFNISRNTDIYQTDTSIYEAYAVVDININNLNNDPGKIYLNNRQLKKSPIDQQNMYISYIDTSSNPNYSNKNWELKGSNYLPSFKCSINKGFADFSNKGFIPDTVYLSQGLTLHISGITDVDSIEIAIDDMNANFSLTKFVSPNDSICEFTASELMSSISVPPNTTQSSNIRIGASYFGYKEIDGQIYFFQLEHNLQKIITVKN